jgi:hypothetical protein
MNSVKVLNSIYPNGMTSEEWDAKCGIDINEVPTYTIGAKSTFPEDMTSEEWEAKSKGLELTGYADINPNTSVYPNNMTREEWNAYISNKNNVNRLYNSIGYTLDRMQKQAV